MARHKIAFFFPAMSAFVQTDINILTQYATVETYHFRAVKGGIRVAVEMLRQLLFLITKGHRCKIFYCWFADQHSLLPVIFARLYRKPCYLVVGGYDVARMPQLNYGVFVSRMRGFATVFSMRKATINLAVSGYVMRKVKAIAPSSKIKLVYNCISDPPSKVSEAPRRSVLTVALIDSDRTYYLKGIDRFVEAARILTDIDFVIVGMTEEYRVKVESVIPANVQIFPPTPSQSLIRFYREARICCQLSRSESFGISLADAIAHGCIPLVTRVGGLTEIVSDPTFWVKDDPESIALAIRHYMKSPITPEIHRNEILRRFNRENRERKLVDLLKLNQ